MQKKAFVLLSGGIDSSTCLSMAINGAFDAVEAVSFNYGQRHSKELQHAGKICDYYNIKHTILDIGDLLTDQNVMLAESSRDLFDVPDISYNEISGISPTYVPFRNGTMLSILTAHAQKYVMQQISEWIKFNRNIDESDSSVNERAQYEARDLVTLYFGAHADDGNNWAYPDCTPEFIGAMSQAIYVGSYFTIRLVAPFTYIDKAGIIKIGSDLYTPYFLTWSCYKGNDVHCGKCPTCISRSEAFIAAGVNDPTRYENDPEDAPF